MRKICFAAILLIFPAAPLWAEGDSLVEPAAAQTPIPLDEAEEFAGPVLLAAGSETSRVTTFKYNRPDAEDRSASKAKAADSDPKDQTDSKQLQRSRSRPKVATYGYNPGGASAAAPAPATPADDSKPVRRGLSEPKVTTFEYKRPAPAQPAEVKKPEPAPQPAQRPAKRSRAAKASEAGSQPAPVKVRSVGSQPDERRSDPKSTRSAPAAAPKAAKPEPAAAQGSRPADDEPPVPPKDEVKFTTLNPRTEELEMAKPEAVTNRGRATRVRAARKKAESAPALPTPAFDGSTSFNVAGVYVNCPKNKEENCGQASEEFKTAFPVDQTAPYVMIRKDGRGYLAPDEKRTMSFTWQFLGDNALLIIMEDAKHRKIEYRAEGRYLRNMATGDLFFMSLTDAEWNVEPVPYSKIKARKDKKK